MNFASLDLNLLRVFDAVIAEQSATRAGERLGLSQPAVSAALNRLRHALGDRLFLRQGSRMVPTAKALALHGPVREALASVEQAVTALASFDPAHVQRTFRLLGSDYFAEMLMPGLSAQVAEEAPGVMLQLIDSGRGDVERQLADRDIDLALDQTMELPDWVSRSLVLQSTVVLAAARDNEAIAAAGIAPGEVIPLDLLCAMPHAFGSPSGMTTGVIDLALAEIGRRRQVRLTLAQFHSVAAVVAQGQFIATLPKALVHKYADVLGLAVYALPVQLPRIDLHMYWNRRHDEDEAHKWLRDKVRRVLAPYDERGSAPGLAAPPLRRKGDFEVQYSAYERR